MKPTTATAIVRAGLALQGAIRLVDDDDSCPPRLAELLHSMDRLADRLVDVPMPPPRELEQELAETMTATSCPSCGLSRLVSALSRPECPRCHHVDPSTGGAT